MEIFTLTPSTSSGQALTLSLKGEGIAELRKSYQDSQDYKDEQDWEAINEILKSYKAQFRHSLCAIMSPTPQRKERGDGQHPGPPDRAFPLRRLSRQAQPA